MLTTKIRNLLALTVFAAFAFTGNGKSDGGLPSRTAMACSNWARDERASTRFACALLSCVCACATSAADTTPDW